MVSYGYLWAIHPLWCYYKPDIDYPVSVVVLGVAGSSPVSHPYLSHYMTMTYDNFPPRHKSLFYAHCEN